MALDNLATRTMSRLDRVVPPMHHPWDTRGVSRFLPLARKLYRAYRQCIPFVGYPALRKMFRAGFPLFLQRPLEFLLTEQLTPDEEVVVTSVERLRASLISRGTEEVHYYVLAPTPEERLAKTISWRRIATTSSVVPYWGTFLYLCTKAHRSRTVLELGSCAGISGCYLASNPACEQVITVEGSPDLAAVAATNLAEISSRATVLPMSFDDALDSLLPKLPDPLDCVFIDGHHEGKARLHYTGRVTPFMRSGSLMIWDDIHWTPDLLDAWLAFSRSPGVSCAINVGRFGMVVWDKNSTQRRHYDFSAYAGYWGRGKPRPGS